MAVVVVRGVFKIKVWIVRIGGSRDEMVFVWVIFDIEINVVWNYKKL